MPREKEGYRDTIEDLRMRGYPSTLTVDEVMEITGIKSRNTVKKHFKFNKMHQITLADFARQVCV